MATARDVVYRALRIAQIAPADTSGNAVSATDAANGLTALNDMLKGWEAQGVDLNHDTDYTLNDTFETATLTAKYRDAVTYCLAKAIAPEYGRSLTLEAAQMAENGWKTIQGNFLTSVDLVVDKGLRNMPSQRWGYWSGRNY